MSSTRELFNDQQYLSQYDYMLRYLFDEEELLLVREHFHDFYEIYFLMSGEVEYTVEGRVFSLRAGDILLINRQFVHHAIARSNNYSRLMLWISPGWIDKISTETTNLHACFKYIENRKNKNLVRLNPTNSAKIQSILDKIIKMYQDKTYGSDILLRSYICELLVIINRYNMEMHDQIPDYSIGSSPLIEKTLLYINNNISENLSLDKICEIQYVSKYHLLREFKRYMGYTVHQYILIKRLLLAKDLLLENQYSITEIAHLCGFSDYANFIRTFTNHYGMSPKKFAKQSSVIRDSDFINFDIEIPSKYIYQENTKKSPSVQFTQTSSE